MKEDILITGFVEKIIKEFPSASIWYEFSPSSQTHFLKVVPQVTYDSSSFKELGMNLYMEWYEADFPNHDFCLISKDSLVKLTNPSLKYAPSQFELSIDVEKSAVFSETELPQASSLSDISLIVHDFEVNRTDMASKAEPNFHDETEKYSLAA